MLKRRLLILIWNMGIGGIQKRVRDIVCEISKDDKWEVYVVIKFRNPSNFVEPIQHLNGVHLRYFTNSHEDSKGVFSAFWVLFQFWKIKPNVILTFLDHLSVMTLIFRRLFFWRNIRVVLNEGTVTSRYLFLNHRQVYWRFLIRWFYRYATKIIVPSKAVKHDLDANFKVPQNLFEVIPNWTLFKPISQKKLRYDLIYVGRFEEEKNVLGFISVIEKVASVMPNINVVMLGEGSQQEIINERLKHSKLKKKVTMLGFSYETRSFFLQSKILVLPSKNEGMPNVVIEAGMCQMPTVCSNFKGADEIIDDGETGCICKTLNEMSKSIVELLVNNEKRIMMGLAAQRRMRKRHSLATQKRFIDTLLIS